MSARRLDWHVLLPGARPADPGRWLLLGGSPDLPRLAVELGLAGSATTTCGDGERAEVVALLHGAAERVERIAQSLSPGGVLYWEVDRTVPGRAALTPGRARRHLRQVGLTPLATYWVGPGWECSTRYLPVDPAGPLAWYLATVAVAAGPVAAAMHAILRLALHIRGVAGLVAPRFAIVATVDPTPETRCPAVLADPALPAGVRRSPVPPVLVSGGEEEWSRITLLAFEADGAAPAAVVKVARRLDDDEATRHEHDVLVELRERLEDAFRQSVPAPLAVVAGSGRATIVQGAAPGVSAVARMRRWPRRAGRGERDLALAAAWLVALHTRMTRSRAVPGSSDWNAHVVAPLERFVEVFHPGDAVARLLQQARAHATTVTSGLPIVLEHRDLGPWNVLVEGGRVHVVDWEVARDGPAMTDLVYAALHWSFTAHDAAREVDRRALLRRLVGANPEDAEHVSFRATLHRYAEAMEIDPRLTPALVVLTLVGQALDRHDRLMGAGSATRAANRYVGYVEELAELGAAWLTGPLTRAPGEVHR